MYYEVSETTRRQNLEFLFAAGIFCSLNDQKISQGNILQSLESLNFLVGLCSITYYTTTLRDMQMREGANENWVLMLRMLRIIAELMMLWYNRVRITSD